MRDLTTADIAFLLCTSQHGARYHLTLETSYGLLITLGANGSISVALQHPATTPTATNLHGHSNSRSSSIDSIDAMLLSPFSPQSQSYSPLGITNGVSASTGSDRVEDTRKKSRSRAAKRQEGYGYRIWPDWRSSSYTWYAPGWPGNPRRSSSSSGGSSSDNANDKRVREEDLEARYSGEWFDAYLDWVERAERAMMKVVQYQHQHQHQHQHRGQGDRGAIDAKVYRGGPFMDEGERTLWMVEGLLLACWLCLQPDVGVVEYQPADDIHVLHPGSVGSVLQGFLRSVRA